MKIIAIGRNYAAHIAELHNEKPTEPVIFTKPDTAILKNNEPFYYPEFSNDIHHEVELIFRVCKEGKYIPEQYALNYIDQIGLGIDFTARDLQSKAKEKGLPWDIAKGFNGSAPISPFLPISQFPDIQNINFRLLINREEKQKGNSGLMIYQMQSIISYVSRFYTLKTGDILFSGTPEGVGPVKIGDRLEGFIENEKLLDFEIK